MVRKFAHQFDNLVEINLDKNPEKAQLFAGKDVSRSLQLLQIDYDTEITPGKTLIFFDEIQAAPNLLPMLRYFYEERPDLHVIAAGSLLEFLLADHDFSMPVGRVEYLHLGPMDMADDLLMVNNGALAEQFVSQHLLYAGPGYEKPQLFYWNRDHKSAGAKVDYLIAHLDKVVPVEVKAGTTGSLKSLQVFVAEKKSPVGLRFNAMPPSCFSYT